MLFAEDQPSYHQLWQKQSVLSNERTVLVVCIRTCKSVAGQRKSLSTLTTFQNQTGPQRWDLDLPDPAAAPGPAAPPPLRLLQQRLPCRPQQQHQGGHLRDLQDRRQHAGEADQDRVVGQRERRVSQKRQVSWGDIPLARKRKNPDPAILIPPISNFLNSALSILPIYPIPPFFPPFQIFPPP